MRPRAHQMLDKSISAMLAAIEVYNKPTFLAVNAWELLLKNPEYKGNFQKVMNAAPGEKVQI